MRYLILVLMFLISMPSALAAVTPDERLADPVLEARARELGRLLRCPVCQNTSIDESNASLAHDLRVLVRERLKAGDSDAQVLQFMRQRYGDFILLDPPFSPVTWALWLAPVGGLIVLGAVALRRWRATAGAEEPPLTEDQREAARRFLAAHSGPVP